MDSFQLTANREMCEGVEYLEAVMSRLFWWESSIPGGKWAVGEQGMNRTDRLLGIVLEIQARKHVRAEDLAATFEVSKRTIYRDMLALAESGVPVVSVPGRGYSLVEGYFLPPLTFTTDEALMLLLGADVVAQNFDTLYRRAAQMASHKIVAVLPEGLRQEVEYLEGSIQFVALGGPATPGALPLVRQAIVQRRTVRFQYQPRYRDGTPDAASEREADPYALLHVGDVWLMVAYCHLRHELRHFRLDRMEDAALLERRFVRPADFKIQPGDQTDRTLTVRVLFDRATLRRAREAPSGFQVAEEERSDGLLVTLRVRQPEDVLHWLLGWGAHVRVLEPAALRARVIQEAEGILARQRT